jgi:hypothetical protein
MAQFRHLPLYQPQSISTQNKRSQTNGETKSDTNNSREDPAWSYDYKSEYSNELLAQAIRQIITINILL